jgi:alpha-ketoglutarate-dependent 2,4-dichlorophenoxyacetate dioxygenase
MSFFVNQLQPLFAGEVTGFDLRDAGTPQNTPAIVAAMDRYAVLVFRNQTEMSDEQQVTFSRSFGSLQRAANFGRDGNQDVRLQSDELFDVSNLDEKNAILEQNDRRRMYRLGNLLWHTDSSFRQSRASYSILRARVVPPSGSDTQFADMRAAYDALDPALQQKITGLQAEHSLWRSREVLGFTNFTAQEKAQRPPAHHPIAQIHPGSKRPTLYLASHASHVVGWPVAEGRLLLAELMEFATQPQFVYRHQWRVGDVVIWDNRCTMHRGTPFDDATHVRDLRRTTVNEAA